MRVYDRANTEPSGMWDRSTEIIQGQDDIRTSHLVAKELGDGVSVTEEELEATNSGSGKRICCWEMKSDASISAAAGIYGGGCRLLRELTIELSKVRVCKGEGGCLIRAPEGPCWEKLKVQCRLGRRCSGYHQKYTVESFQ